ncbi:hypothetical protein L935_03955 [Helicobacter pylori PZ5086]|nr:hypothetical protein L935_03955 [Helicobacter pylori PZ5086]
MNGKAIAMSAFNMGKPRKPDRFSGWALQIAFHAKIRVKH